MSLSWRSSAGHRGPIGVPGRNSYSQSGGHQIVEGDVSNLAQEGHLSKKPLHLTLWLYWASDTPMAYLIYFLVCDGRLVETKEATTS